MLSQTGTSPGHLRQIAGERVAKVIRESTARRRNHWFTTRVLTPFPPCSGCDIFIDLGAEVGLHRGVLPAGASTVGTAAGGMVIGADGDSTARSVRRAARGAAAVAAVLLLANCASSGKFASRVDPKYGVSSSPRVVAFGEPVPKGGGTYRVGKPYTVGGRIYVPEEDTDYREEGMASWYGDDFHGRLTANGEVFDMASLTAAHPTLPMPCYARVTNLGNGKSLIVRVNDRGPYHGNRLIDVSNRAAELLEFKGNGVARVRVEYVGRAPLEGSDDRQLIATLRTGVPAPSPSLVRVASARPFVPEIPSSGPRRSAARSRCRRGGLTASATRSADQASINATSEMSASSRARSAGRVLDNPRAVTYEATAATQPAGGPVAPMRRSIRAVRANC